MSTEPLEQSAAVRIHSASAEFSSCPDFHSWPQRQALPWPLVSGAARFDVVNIFDKEYQIRNGTGVGVGAPQFGRRRGLFFGLSKSLGSGT
ncbi:MAG: hypothetical protein ACLPTF_20470 [Steroidobacteraceae bacterium]